MAITWTISAHDTQTTFNFYVERGINCGYPEPNNIITPYGLADGAYFQRQVYGARSFALQGVLYVDTYLEYHQFRQLLIDHIKRDVTATVTPLTLTYAVDGTTLQIEAYYQGGLEGDGDLVGFNETMTLRFLAVDPFWEETSDDTAALNLSAATTFNYIARNTAVGVWDNMDSGVNSQTVYAIAEDANNVYVGGDFHTAGVGALTVNHIARWDKTTLDWHALGGLGTEGTNDAVRALAIDSTGVLWIGGAFTTAAGVTVNRFCSYDLGTDTFTAYGGLGAEGFNSIVYTLAIDTHGDIFIGGRFTQCGGVAGYNYMAKLDVGTGAFSTLGVAAQKGAGSYVWTSAYDQDNTIYFGGEFTTINGAGTTCYGLCKYTISTNTLAVVGTNGIARKCYALAYGLGNLWIGVDYNAALAGGEVIYGLARWDGISFIQYYITEVSGVGSVARIYSLSYDTTNNYLYVGGYYTAVNGNSSFSTVAYLDDDYAWHNIEVDLSGAEYVSVISSYTGIINYGLYNGVETAFDPTSTTVNNTGTAYTFPVFEIEGPGDVVKITNTTTNQILSFSGLTLATGETLTIDLTQGNKSITTDLRGANVTRYLDTNSNFGQFCLMPGNNVLSLQVEDTCVDADVTWTPRHWSFDAAG